jgi:hypothetical protein
LIRAFHATVAAINAGSTTTTTPATNISIFGCPTTTAPASSSSEDFPGAGDVQLALDEQRAAAGTASASAEVSRYSTTITAPTALALHATVA